MLDDLRFGVRLLSRNPGFTATAIAALALGFGATSAMVSVLDGVLLKPLPFPHPERLVRIYEDNPVERFHMFPPSPADFLDYSRENRVFDAMAMYVRQDQQYGGERPERLAGLRVSGEFFRVFGARPMLGRAFTAQEEARSGATDVVIVSHAAWRRIWAADRQVIGKTIELTGSPFRIVGVMPPEFDSLEAVYRLPRGENVDVWLPLNGLGNSKGVPRAFHYGTTVARLKPETGLEKAQADMNLIAGRLEAEYPDDKNWRVHLIPLEDDLVRHARSTLLILAGAAGCVLLVACVNVANLLLARAAAREREMAIRSAVGASRARLVRQMLTESVTLSAVGLAPGLLLAAWSVRAVRLFGPQDVPRLQAIGLDARVIVVAAALSALCGILFGLAPALHVPARWRRRPASVFAAAEIALSFVLLTAAGLLARSFGEIARVEPGFNPRGVLTLNTSLSYPKLIGARRYAAFYERFVEKLAKLPGVSAAGAGSRLPWAGGTNDALFGIVGRPRPASASMHAHYEFVSPDFLRTLGVSLVAGRWLAVSDHFDAPKVVLINKTMALAYWPKIEACLGQQIYTMRDAYTPEAPMTIVGVVGDIKDNPVDAYAQATFYTPFLQSPSFGNYVALRTAADPGALIPAAREVAREMGNDLSLQEIRPMEQVAAAATATQRFSLQIVGGFAVAALALALIGIYGVMSYASRRRAREVAIRTALGATPADTLRLLAGHGARLIAAGLLAGFLASLALTRVMAGMLFRVSAADPVTFGAVATVLAATAMAACIVPACKALDLDPAEALRRE